MKKLSSFVAAAAAALFSVGAQALVIDDFNDDTALIFASTTGSSATAFTAGGMIGGERDIKIEKLANPGNPPPLPQGSGTVTAEVADGKFILGQAGSSYGKATLQWDGVDGSMGVNTNGLGGVDLSAGGTQVGFQFRVYAEQATSVPDAEVLITIWDGIGGTATFQFTAFNTSVEIDAQILFNEPGWVFAGGFATDFSKVGAIELVMNVTGEAASLDVELDIIETKVPEPSSLLLAGLALTGVGAAARRRRVK